VKARLLRLHVALLRRFGPQRRRLLGPRGLLALGGADPGTVTRSAGTYRLEARRARAFTAWLIRRFGGRFHGMRRAPLTALRAELLAVPGLGAATVDAILLYAAGRPVAVADASTRRVLVRHRLIARTAGYEETREFLEARLPSDPALLGELHALVVAVGKAFCRATPYCAECPLRRDLRGRPPAQL
jgi:endonuclease-3 related protein